MYFPTRNLYILGENTSKYCSRILVVHVHATGLFSLLISSFNMCGFNSDFLSESKSKSILGCSTHQAGIFGVKCFSIFCGLILADLKSGEILMPNDLIYSHS